MKTLNKILSLSCAALVALSATACGVDLPSSGDGEESLELMKTGGREVIFEYLDAGFGNNPYIAVANGFMKRHPDVQIRTLANRQIAGTTANNLDSGTGVSSIYSYPYDTMKTWIANGWIEDLTDLLDRETLDGRTMRESITGGAEKAISVNNKMYAVPEYTSVTGFIYNVALFEQYGWEVPNTTKELEELCKKILADTNNKVAPITWCKDAEGYLYFATENWISQYEGVANMEKFYEYESAEIYALEDNDAGSLYSAKYGALKNLVKFFLPMKEGGYAHDLSRTIDNTSAQYAVMEGTCAMMLNGSWFENEMSLYWGDEKIGMFPVPQLCDEEGEVMRASNYTAVEGDKRVLSANYGAYYFIPTAAPNKDDAKDFLLYLSSEEACEIYTQYSNAVRPFIYDCGKETELYQNASFFGKYVLEMADQYYLYSPVSNSALDLKGKAGLWPRGARVESEILAASADKNPLYWLQKDYNFAQSSWEDWLALIG